jgi:3-oxoacyl-(acyl-carrier-protein) synthase
MSQQDSNEVYITGLGAVCAIGNNLSEIHSALCKGKSGIKKLTKDPVGTEKNFTVGEVKLSNQELAEHTEISKDLPRTALLAVKAATEAIEHSGYKSFDNLRVGLILGTTVGGMDKTEDLYPKNENPKKYLPSHHSGYTTDFLASHLNIKDYTNTISTACSSGANAIMTGARLIKQDVLDIVIAGGSDAICAFTLNGFKSLMILDDDPCKPFSAERKGLNLGEGAGFVVLESEKIAVSRQAKTFCAVSGYANTNDAFHQTASSPDGRGAYNAMASAIKMANVSTSDIDYINVHGTGTGNNDLTEGIALKKLFANKVPDFSTTKAFTGHCLGAAGAIEAIISVLAIQNQEVYPNLNFTNPIIETGLIPITEYTKKPVRSVLSNSFGFGGCDTSLVFSSVTK